MGSSVAYHQSPKSCTAPLLVRMGTGRSGAMGWSGCFDGVEMLMCVWGEQRHGFDLV